MDSPGALRAIFEHFVRRRRIYCVYAACPEQGEGRPDEQIATYDAPSPPPESVVALYRRYAGPLASRVMLGRLKRHGAVMLALVANDDLAAFGWIQTWAPLKREFWWLAEDGYCLGPYWTHPRQRGRGIYGRLLAHSLWVCYRRGWRDLYIWTEEANTASARGIEKAGFRSLGKHSVLAEAGGLIRRHAVVEPPPSV